MNFIVTGGSGFIGTNLIQYLYKQGHSITNLDKQTYASNNALLALKDRYVLNIGDVCSHEDVQNVFKTAKNSYGKIDAVIHMAAESHVDRSIKDSDPFAMTNMYGTQVVCRECLENSTRLIFMSTDEVYGSVPSGESKETDPIVPSSPYSASKAGAEMLAFSYFKTHGLSVCSVRASNCYGPYQHLEKFIPHMYISAKEGRSLPVYGDGSNSREWMFVKDACIAIEAVTIRGRSGEAYNAGSGFRMRNLDVAKLILKIMGKPESMISFVEDRKGHDLRYALDCSKIRFELGWESVVNEDRFEDTLKLVLTSYRQRI